MTTRTPDEIDLSTFPTSDGEPMAETLKNMIQMNDLIYALHGLFRAQGRTRVAVGGNQFLYYDPYDKRRHLSPDVYAALDVAPGGRDVWFTWVEGKCPDIVFEITSPSTQDEDLGPKRATYAELGAREYYIYDPQPALLPLFLGFELRAGRYESLPMLPGGGIVSPLLRAELRPMRVEESDLRLGGTYLRVIDPTSGEALPASEDIRLRFEQEAQALRAMQEQLAQEAQARRVAEQRAAEAEASLQATLAAIREQRQGTTPQE